jgi:hypothetical protein
MFNAALAGGALIANETTTATVNVTDSVTSILAIGTQVMNFIAGNSLLMTLFCGSLVGLGCYVVKKVKSVAKK